MPDLVAKARKLIPGTAALLPTTWGESECAQLNIKRNGEFTGEYLYYSVGDLVDSWAGPIAALGWELQTKKSRRTISLRVDRETLRPAEFSNPNRQPRTATPLYFSDDALGDALATPFVGPATDLEQTVFLLRRLPLAVGYKTTVPVTSDTIEPVQMELAVTGIESIQTVAGKFNCYKVAFPGIGQTFWIGVEGARPLVKFQSGAVEADLVKVWGPQNLLEQVAEVVKKAGMPMDQPSSDSGGIVTSWIRPSALPSIQVTLRKRYTPPADIAQALQSALAAETAKLADYRLRPDSVHTRTAGGQQVFSCLLDKKSGDTEYAAWVITGNASVRFLANVGGDAGTFRWRFEPVLDAIRIP
jgi:hypothetical protein